MDEKRTNFLEELQYTVSHHILKKDACEQAEFDEGYKDGLNHIVIPDKLKNKSYLSGYLAATQELQNSNAR